MIVWSSPWIVTVGVGTIAVCASFIALFAMPSRRRAAAPATAPILEQSDVPGSRAMIQGGVNVTGRLRLPSGTVIRGPLSLAEGAVLEGRVEVFGEVQVAERARIVDHLIVHGDEVVGRSATLVDCVIDGELVLDVGARVAGNLECGALVLREETTATTSSELPQVHGLQQTA